MLFRSCFADRSNNAVSIPPVQSACDSSRKSEALGETKDLPAALSAPAPRVRAGRRGSVSAEVSSLSVTLSHRPDIVDKSDEAKARIRAVIQHCFLLRGLEEEQEQGIVDAMFEKSVQPHEMVIREGEEGDNFYVIESGDFVAIKGGRQVFKYEGFGSFGELALLYNCPRAATVQALTAGTLWGVDRVTFRAVVVASTAARRERFEGALAAMPIFSGLAAEQRAAIADCLEPETIAEGHFVLREGAVTLRSDAKFYLVESGTVCCLKSYQGDKRAVATISNGGFFGEVALVTHAPRAADVVAASPTVKLLSLGRNAFERLMGPVEEILADKVREYEALNAQVRCSSSIMPHEVGVRRSGNTPADGGDSH